MGGLWLLRQRGLLTCVSHHFSFDKSLITNFWTDGVTFSLSVSAHLTPALSLSHYLVGLLLLSVIIIIIIKK